MYWLISISWTFVGLIVFWITLSNKWKRIDRLTLGALHTVRIFHPIPGDTNYLDLKFSVVRHSVLFLIASALFYFVRSDFVLTVTLYASMVYHGIVPVQRYRMRKKHIADLREKSDATAHFAEIPVKDSFCVVIHAIISLALTWVLYAIRP